MVLIAVKVHAQDRAKNFEYIIRCGWKCLDTYIQLNNMAWSVYFDILKLLLFIYSAKF